MNRTKRQILDLARELFNNQGVESVTLRQIAKAASISQGNLNYHFKHKADLIEVLYFELVEKLNPAFTIEELDQGLMKMSLNNSLQVMHTLYDYRFVLKNSLQVMKESVSIKKHYQNLQVQRKGELKMIFSHLVKENKMRDEEYTGEYDQLIERMNILGDNWINNQELLYPDMLNPVDHYARLLFGSLYPYLTPQGKAEFLQMIND